MPLAEYNLANPLGTANPDVVQNGQNTSEFSPNTNLLLTSLTERSQFETTQVVR
jgi:hypothetical protein